LLATAKKADPDPWRKRFRERIFGSNRKELERLAKQLRPEKQTPQMIVALAERLRFTGGDAAGILRLALANHGRDFWLFFHLGNQAKDPEEKIGCYRAALVLRPQSGPAHYNLGNALADKKDLEGAIKEYRRAIQLDPKDALAHSSLGNALRHQKDLDGAIKEYRRAIHLDPKHIGAHNNLGLALEDKKDLDGAIKEYRRAIQVAPNFATPHNNLGLVLYAQKDMEGAIKEFRLAIYLDPKFAKPYYNLGMALANRKDLDGALEYCRKAIDLDPKDALAHNNLGGYLAARKDLDGAIKEFRRAIQLDDTFAPTYYNLANALLQQDEFTQARKAIRQSLKLLPVKTPGHQFGQRQLQQCDALLTLDRKLAAFLDGGKEPTASSQRWILARFGFQSRRYHAPARMFASAIATKPALADDLTQGDRYNAACSAVLAAAGKGLDQKKPDAPEKGKLRAQGLEWLQADLKESARRFRIGRVNDLVLLMYRLPWWQQDPDLISVREPKALAVLPDVEQAAWRKLWADVDQLLKQIKAAIPETRLQGTLTDEKRQQRHELKVGAGITYVIDLHSTAFDTHLRLLDSKGKLLTQHHEVDPVKRDSRLILIPAREGTYQIIAGSFQNWGQGAYTLTIRAVSDNEK
jgi:tetratricopeptide (TPR) repeat protein